MAKRTKFNYTSREFLNQIESLAKKGLSDAEIATNIGLNPTYFSEKKAEIPELSEVLITSRAKINSTVRQKYLLLGLGGLKVTKTVYDRDNRPVSTIETELPPDARILANWLYHHDPEWREMTDSAKKIDVTSNGKDLIPSIEIEIIDRRDQVDSKSIAK